MSLKLAATNESTGALDFHLTAWPGCSLFATCTANIAKRREHTEYHLTLKNRSVCGPHSTPSWVVAVAAQVTLQRSRPLQQTNSWLRTPSISLAYAVPRKMLLLLITRPLTVVCPL